MGSIIFEKGAFADHLHELIGFKSGLAASIEQMCDLLSDTGYSDEIRDSESYGLRIHSSDYEELYYMLLYKLGTTEKPYSGQFEILSLMGNLAKKHGQSFTEKIFEIYQAGIKKQLEVVKNTKNKSLDPSEIIFTAHKQFGHVGAEAIVLIIKESEKLRKLSPHMGRRFVEWKDVISLDALFKQYKMQVTHGEHFDQRFIDFLSNNHDQLGSIHWRKFEELIGECFVKFGYKVEIGPGSNDDGVDVRVWDENNKQFPKFIIQCKRQKEKIEKVVIKGLYTDLVEEGAEMGLLVTTSEFSPGAKKVINVRGYPIEEVNGEMLRDWMLKLRTPGTGIIRI